MRSDVVAALPSVISVTSGGLGSLNIRRRRLQGLSWVLLHNVGVKNKT